MGLWEFVIVGIVVAIIFGIGRAVKKQKEVVTQFAEKQKSNMEALFRSSFPELQPHFHPARVYEYVVARRARKAAPGPFTWKNPPGFPGAAAAEIELDGLRDKVRLVDAAGAPVAQFTYEEHPEGGVLRVGKGKLTANVKGPEPRVRYWHPEREFKWTPRTWKMQSSVAESSLESSSSSSSSSDRDWSTSTAATAAAAGAGIVAAGGAFDGGGASAAWDGGGGSSSSGSGSSDFGSVTSGSSSSSSTSY